MHFCASKIVSNSNERVRPKQSSLGLFRETNARHDSVVIVEHIPIAANWRTTIPPTEERHGQEGETDVHRMQGCIQEANDDDGRRRDDGEMRVQDVRETKDDELHREWRRGEHDDDGESWTRWSFGR